MALNIYDIIQGPWVTEKAYYLNNKYKQLVLRVHPMANKPQIREALEKLFNVKVQDIRIDRLVGKRRRVGKHTTQGKTLKKAIITLKPGYMLNVMGSQAPLYPEAVTESGTE